MLILPLYHPHFKDIFYFFVILVVEHAASLIPNTIEAKYEAMGNFFPGSALGISEGRKGEYFSCHEIQNMLNFN